MEKQCHPICHRLWVITICKLCSPCHFCVMLLFKGSYHPSQFLYIPIDIPMSPNYPTSFSMIFVPKLISSFWFGTRDGWFRMHQCPPSDSLTPSTSAPYLGPRLETYIVPWSLQSLVAGFSSLSTVGLHYCLLIDRFYKWLLQQIYSSLSRMY